MMTNEPISTFFMASESDADFMEKRKQQALEGLRQPNVIPSLREDQAQAVNALAEKIENGFMSGYYNLPTGWGKTILASEIILKMKIPTLILVPSKKLETQNIEKLLHYAKSELIITYLDEKKTTQAGDVCIGTYQLIENRLREKANPDLKQKMLNRILQYGLIIFDEAHRAITKKRSQTFFIAKHAIKLGFTATPVFSGKRKRDDYLEASELFGNLIYRMGIDEAIERNILCPFINIVVQANISRHQNEIARLKEENSRTSRTIDLTGSSPTRLAATAEEEEKNENKAMMKAEHKGNYNEEIIESILLDEGNAAMIVDIIFYQTNRYSNTKIYGECAIIFCQGKKHAQFISDALNTEQKKVYPDSPPLSATITADTPEKEREELYIQHENSTLPILVGINVFAEGYDNPNIKYLINNNGNRSLVRAKQCGGRALRKHPNKNFATIIDVYFGLEQPIFRTFTKNKFYMGDIPGLSHSPNSVDLNASSRTSSTTSTLTTTELVMVPENNPAQKNEIKNFTHDKLQYTIYWDGTLPEISAEQNKSNNSSLKNSSGPKKRASSVPTQTLPDAPPSKRPHLIFHTPYPLFSAPPQRFQGSYAPPLSTAAPKPAVPLIYVDTTSHITLPQEPQPTQTSVRFYPKQLNPASQNAYTSQQRNTFFTPPTQEAQAPFQQQQQQSALPPASFMPQENNFPVQDFTQPSEYFYDSFDDFLSNYSLPQPPQSQETPSTSSALTQTNQTENIKSDENEMLFDTIDDIFYGFNF